MAPNVENFLSFAVDVSLKVALLAGIASVVLLVFRVRNPNLQHRVWLAVLLGMLVLPFMVGRTPGIHVHLDLVRRQMPSDFAPTAMPAPEMAPAPAAEPTFVDAPSASPVQIADRPTANVSLPAGGSATAETKRWVPSITITQMTVMGYLFGGLWFFTRLAIGTWQTNRLIRCAKRTELSALQRQVVGETKVRESATIRVPLTVGWWRGMILLPCDWRTWDESMLCAALLHEKEHATGAVISALLCSRS